MKVYDSIKNFVQLPYAVVTIGAFDGVHLGHKKILYRVQELAKENGGESVVITFWPHPRKITTSENSVKVLSSLKERIKLIEECGIDYLLVIEFTKEFAELSPVEFIEKILANTIGTKKLVIGHDHRFGKNREGNFDLLKEYSSKYGYEVEEISRQDIDQVGVSSTVIRQALEKGDVEKAAEYLGRMYSLTGKVVKGKQLGRTIGFPTANIIPEEQDKLIPSDGVYAVIAEVDGQKYGGMLNIGLRPTVNGTKRTIEANLFNFDKDIYEQEITIYFVKYLRNEKKFESLEDLKKQLVLDKEQSNYFLKNTQLV